MVAGRATPMPTTDTSAPIQAVVESCVALFTEIAHIQLEDGSATKQSEVEPVDAWWRHGRDCHPPSRCSNLSQAQCRAVPRWSVQRPSLLSSRYLQP